jgi:hypothetical protein
MQFDIVIAHYKENLGWIENLNHKSIRSIVVYHKGEDIPYINNSKIINIKLNNIGRESHTYLTYCVQYYNNLPDFVIFLQGTPHHGIDVEKINEWINSINKNFHDYTNNYSLGNIDWFLDRGRIFDWGGPVNQSPYSIWEWADIYVRKSLKTINYPIFWNACFGVSKKAILSNSIEKYKKIIDEALQTVNPDSAHFLERLWYYLFNLDILNDISSKRGVDLSKNIWIYWGQNWNNAPLLQRIIAALWIKKNPDWKVYLLNDRNIRKFLLNDEVPYLFDNNKIITYQAKSDIIRLAVLNKYGGVWADSTMLGMQSLNHWVFEATAKTGIWMYHGWGGGFHPNNGIASWFIVSKKNSYIIKKWKESCDQYWLEKNQAHTYFWMDELFRKLYDTDAIFKDYWLKTPNICCEDYGQAHCMARKDGMQINDQQLKDYLSKHPPYALKFWNNWNNIFPDLKSKECLNSVGYHALLIANQDIKYKHSFKI